MKFASTSIGATFISSAPTIQDARNSAVFSHGAFILAICLQRFGFTASGGSYLFLSLVGFYVLLGWGAAVGLVHLRQMPTFLFALVVLWFVLSGVYSIDAPYRGIATSPASLLLAILSNLLFIAGPSSRFDSDTVFKVFLFYVRLCAIISIAQIVLQLGGIRIFSFGDITNALDPILIEKAYNQSAVEAYGSLNKRANGFFPLEPSTLSQLLMIAIIVDVFILKRMKYVPLYAISYLLSGSGSGLLVLAATFVIYPFVSPIRSMGIVISAIAIAAALAITWTVYPEPFDPILRRANEFNSTQSSAYARYLAQFDTWEYLFRSDRVIIGTGPGSLERSPAFFPGSQNPALKVGAEYGLIGLAIFAVYFVGATFRMRNALLSLMMLSCYQLGAGNFVIAPTLILVAMLCIWTVPEPSVNK